MKLKDIESREDLQRFLRRKKLIKLELESEPRMNLETCPNCGAAAKIVESGFIDDHYLAWVECSEEPYIHFRMADIGPTQEDATKEAVNKWNVREKKTPEGATSHFNSITDLDIPQWMFHTKHTDCLYSVGQHLVAFNVLKDYIKVFRFYDAENLDFSVSGIGSLKGSPFAEFNNHDYPKEERLDLMEWLDGRKECQ